MTRDITPAGSPATGSVDEAFAEGRASFDRFCLAAGIEALGTMMEADVTAACGPRHGRDAARRAHRWGRTQGRIGFHGGKNQCYCLTGYARNILRNQITQILQMSDKVRFDLLIDYLRQVLPEVNEDG